MDVQLEIYVDGGCKGNGSANAKAYASMHVRYQGRPAPIGPGIWMELSPKLSDNLDNQMDMTARTGFVSVNFPSLNTNQQAELAAILLACRYIEVMERANPTHRILAKVHTDSAYALGHLTENWKPSKQATNERLKQVILQFLSTRRDRIQIIKVGREVMVSAVGH